ncbi:ATP-dependent DNA helicase Q-like 3 [Anabarilius grahami]|uniref:ATP-dependent DNA helicase Q-like 3 n=1 Tax=Anabarilius grahami TaxID=495550 RepID=A0A3N0Z4G7_ANAGA|nr:ATP-dependent DNA helicase Q-like 3 [Anabarilius grahami]
MMAVVEELRCVDSAIASVLEDIDSALILKEEQRTAIKAFVDGKDVFAVLPTGFRKSLIYQLAPMVAKKMGCNENPVVIVVSPLVALMENQVKEATEMGITAMHLPLILLSKIKLVLAKMEGRLYTDVREQAEMFKRQLHNSKCVQAQLREELGRASDQLRDFQHSHKRATVRALKWPNKPDVSERRFEEIGRRMKELDIEGDTRYELPKLQSVHFSPFGSMARDPVYDILAQGQRYQPSSKPVITGRRATDASPHFHEAAFDSPT